MKTGWNIQHSTLLAVLTPILENSFALSLDWGIKILTTLIPANIMLFNNLAVVIILSAVLLTIFSYISEMS
jgi:hypothetical protein